MDPEKRMLKANTRRKENIEEWVQKELKELEGCDEKFQELKQKVESKSKPLFI